ncbi:MAG TPA: sugar phosphate isomerase/epimerase family protein [Sphaerochaeta sp.]|nr:sugar phosphate isomerase/epimerase family protein [Sphaerochaeta sp.]HOE89855.1 sugar phosphate isomerase/epimerase family protein [Sphaerochaeta sp.]HOR80204.1 sugar phosphate isomerase/epimerase family protein [Sphaerochaeta sp.]HPB41439.1 sugar phosphate isomerase/epimerase family protein [Sphaerochaeta sp.]HPK64491.1 sugar phosphate isomerase/epimerase family protein [Sphaerochaeta sp.]
MMRFGVRAHDLGSFDTPEALAAAVRTFGEHLPVQLAVAKSFPSSGPLDEAFALRIREAFDRQHVSIAVLGCYINPIHPDPAERERQLKRFEEHLALASILGAPMVGTETGSVRPDCSYHPDTAEPKHLETLYSSLDRLVEYAVKVGSVVAVEAVAKQNTICSIERMARLAERFDTPRLKIIYDPVNLIPWIGIPEADGSFRARPSLEAQRAFTDSALDAFGLRIAALHVKDFVLDEHGFKIGNLPALEGVFDWPALLADLRSRKISVPALLENANPATLESTLSTFYSL